MMNRQLRPTCSESPYRGLVRAVIPIVGVLVALSGAGCGLLFNRDPGPPHPKATISGTVRGPDNTAPAVNRTIRAIDTKAGKRYTIRTNNVGDYTFFLAPGYRLEFPLRRGEALTRQPDPIEVGPADLKRDVDFELTRANIAKRP